MKIMLDAMGSDNGAVEFVKGAYLAMKDSDVEIVLVGNEAELTSLMKNEDPEGKYSSRISVKPVCLPAGSEGGTLPLPPAPAGRR